MTARIARRDYGTREELASALANGVAAVLAGGIATNGRALLAVSGGSTPKLFFEHLAREPVEWGDVTVLPVDERLVHPEHERANARLIRERLLAGRAGAATFAPMGELAGRMRLRGDEASVAVSGAGQVDAMILGMGTDGHTASFFADGDAYDEATDPAAALPVLPIRTPGQPDARITLTMPVIARARFLALHIEGEEKREVFERAVAGVADGADLPIARVLAHVEEIAVFWAP